MALDQSLCSGADNSGGVWAPVATSSGESVHQLEKSCVPDHLRNWHLAVPFQPNLAVRSNTLDQSLCSGADASGK